jgi:5'-methylthioadenosine phosphorylase
MKTLGVIGGSGLYDMPGLTDVEHVTLSTPFGEPSDEFVRGRLGEVQLVFLPRHGRGHRWLPTEINYRANLFGMKQLGVEWLVSVAAVGSLRGEIAPGHFVVPDQFIDRTVARPSTFFGGGIVAHASMADPVCPVLSRLTVDAATAAGGQVHAGGTYVCMEGPQFSTRAESELYRSWGAHLIGMTNWQEAKLAREAEICFATLAIVSDYDCWNTEARDVTIDDILRLLAENADLARRCVARVAQALPDDRSCGCATALKDAIITDRDRIPAEIRRDLSILVGKYLEA